MVMLRKIWGFFCVKTFQVCNFLGGKLDGDTHLELKGNLKTFRNWQTQQMFHPMHWNPLCPCTIDWNNSEWSMDSLACVNWQWWVAGI